MAMEIVLPHMGEGVIEGTISKWLVTEGAIVKQYEPILEIETDKVTTEATAEQSGVLLKILVPEGRTVSVGTVLGYLGESTEDVPARSPAVQAVPPQPVATPTVQPVNGGLATNVKATDNAGTLGRISPVVGRIAEEHQVDLTQLVGTGRNGRITKKDILAYLDKRTTTTQSQKPASQPTTPQALPKQSGEIVPLTSIRRAIAEHMVRSKATSPHVTTIFEVDFNQVMTHRRANKAQFAHDEVNLTLTAYIVFAIAHALKAHPIVNSSWTEQGVELKREINVGVATAIPDGLIVPVVKGADGLSLLGIARTVNDLSERARAGGLRPDEVQGGTFTLTNHGVSGSLFATPIINQPECGILGVGLIEKRVKVVNDAIAIRPLAYVGLTFDHRILDGASADGFVMTIKEVIEGWEVS